MSERYSRLFSLPEKLYAEGAPVLIAAGALLKDNQTGKVLAQLKLNNIGSKAIKTAKVKLSPLDSVGRSLENNVIYEYLDLSIRRDEAFGSKNAIQFPDASARAYTAEVIEIGFEDNSVWSGTNQEWTPLEKQDSLAKLYADKELVRQFQIEYGGSAVFEPKCDRDLWLCFCGAVNHKEETECHVCVSNPNYDLSSLKEKCEQRLEREAAEAKAKEERRAAEEAAAQAQKEAKGKKTRKILAILLSSIAVVIAAVLLLTLIVFPSKRYKDAIALGDAGQYDLAISGLEALNGYKDSNMQIEYYKAESMLASGEYDSAIKSFFTLSGFRDSDQRVEEARKRKLDPLYASAENLLMAGNYDEAISAFKALGDYRDSAQRVQEATGQKYAEAEAFLSAEDYDRAIEIFRSLGDYRNSAEKVREATEQKQSVQYAEATALLSSGEYDAAIAIFAELGRYRDSDILLSDARDRKQQLENEQKYNDAVGLYELRDYQGALELFFSLYSYKDSKDYIEYIKSEYASTFDSLLGTYQSSSDGKHKIEINKVTALSSLKIELRGRLEIGDRYLIWGTLEESDKYGEDYILNTQFSSLYALHFSGDMITYGNESFFKQ